MQLLPALGAQPVAGARRAALSHWTTSLAAKRDKGPGSALHWLSGMAPAGATWRSAAQAHVVRKTCRIVLLWVQGDNFCAPGSVSVTFVGHMGLAGRGCT